MNRSSPINVSVFDENAKEYDAWFDEHPSVFESELAAVRELIPSGGSGIEIGAGTGRFAQSLGIKTGVEPAPEMAAIARSRGITIERAFAEELPFKSEEFDFALLVTVLCFVNDPIRVLSEIRRVLKPGGLLLIGFIDRESRTGRQVLTSGSKYYRNAFLYSARDILEMVTRAGFQWKEARQTLFHDPKTMTAPESPKPGFGTGDFVVFSARKPFNP